MKQKLVALPYIILSFSSSNITSIKKKKIGIWPVE